MDLRVPQQVIDVTLAPLSEASLAEGRRLKKEGMKIAAANSAAWRARAEVAVLEQMRTAGADSLEFMGEDLVQMAFAAGAGWPPKPQAVGPFVLQLLKHKLIEWTGKRLPLRTPRSHGRKSDVYRYITSQVSVAQTPVDADIVSANDPLAHAAA